MANSLVLLPYTLSSLPVVAAGVSGALVFSGAPGWQNPIRVTLSPLPLGLSGFHPARRRSPFRVYVKVEEEPGWRGFVEGASSESLRTW